MQPGGLVLFDIDGTLVRLAGAGRAAVEAGFAEVFGVADARALFEPIRFDGNTDRAILGEAARRAGIEEARLRELHPAFEAVYLRALALRVGGLGPECVLPGVVELLEALRGRGDTVGLLTGNSERGARAKLEPFGLNRFFPAGAFGSDHEDRRVLAGLARERLEAVAARPFAPDRVRVVGDSVMDVRAGRAQGFGTIAVLTGWTAPEALAAESPDLLLGDLRELLARL